MGSKSWQVCVEKLSDGWKKLPNGHRRSGDSAIKNKRTKRVYKVANIENGGSRKERLICKILVI